MSFVAKNPLSMTEIEHTPSTPTGTRGLFAKKDGWYEVDEKGNVYRICNLEDIGDFVSDLTVDGDIIKITKFDGSTFEFNLPTSGGTGGSIIVDDKLDIDSENPVQNKVVTGWIIDLENIINRVNTNKAPVTHTHGTDDIVGLKDLVVVDEVLDDTSTNPVQNKIITGTIDMIINDKANIIHSHSISEINQLETELEKKLDAQRANADCKNPVTETWGINILGNALTATLADEAAADSGGRRFSEYTSAFDFEVADDKSLKITEWSSSGAKEGGFSNHRFATTDYVEEKLAGKLDESMVDNSLSSESENPVQNKVIHGVLQEIINNKAHISHKHKVADLEDYVVDEFLNDSSTNPVQNKHIAFHISELMNADADLSNRIDTEIGNIDTALDSIIAIQNSLIGGDM